MRVYKPYLRQFENAVESVAEGRRECVDALLTGVPKFAEELQVEARAFVDLLERKPLENQGI